MLAVIYALLALNAWAQVVLVPLGRSGDPLLLTALQFLIGAAAAVAAWEIWSAAKWAPGAILIHGFITAGMLASLGPMLDLPGDARPGLWVGAAAVILWSLVFAWYLRRVVRRRQVS